MQVKLDVLLPWPPKTLSPNARVPIFQKARIFKKTRIGVCLLTKKALHDAGIDAVRVKGGTAEKMWRGGQVDLQLTCIPPILRYRDEDNLIATCKAAFDGIAEALRVDDTIFHFKEQLWRPVQAPGQLIVTISWEEP